MALTIGQAAAISYPVVVAEKRSAANQWEQSALLKELERQGAIVHKSLGATIEAPLDYQRNVLAGFLASSLAQNSLATETTIVGTASYSIAELAVPMVWTKMTEVQNSSDSQKVAFVRQMIENALNSHDDLIEEALATTSTSGFLGLRTHIADDGQGSDGGIDSATETWWRNVNATYTDDTDIEAALTSAWNSAAKGSGSSLVPTLLVSDGATQALFEGTQQALQRYADQDLKAGFKTLMFKTARYVFSQKFGTRIFGLNPKNFKVIVSKEYFRDRGETIEIPDRNGFTCKVYSALQSITDNRSRLFVVHT